MGTGARLTENVLAGREAETSEVRRFLDGAVQGIAGMLLVTGEAGVGKTALVEHVCAEFADRMTMLAGRCLPLSTMSVPFLPLRSALRDARGGGLASSAIAGFENRDSMGNVPVELDAWLDDRCAEAPVVLFVDDLQWADQSTLDALMYLVAGPRNRRLALIATIRVEELDEGHPLNRWLADIRRMPGTTGLSLPPLDRMATALQMSGILEEPPHESLVDDVFSRTCGNPYLTRLLMVGQRPESRHIATDIPADLSGAVLRSWRRLSPQARQLTRFVAIGGLPVATADLIALVHADVAAEDLIAQLQEAVGAAVLEPMPDGRYWFHHPMIAEALHQATPVDECTRWHTMFADALERDVATRVEPPVEMVVAVADHRYAAGQLDQAFAAALAAADATRAVGGNAEMLRLLTRALALRDQVHEASLTRTDLLEGLIAAARAVGADFEELTAVEALLKQVSPEAEPLRRADILLSRESLRFRTGKSFWSVDGAQEMVELTKNDPQSSQHASALASLALSEYWSGDERFISEKTVSSHVSNLLRKTGARNRIDLARLVSKQDVSVHERGESGSGGLPPGV